MAKNRLVNTKFWDDQYVRKLDYKGKLLFFYILTNTLTNICGIYEIDVQRIEFDTTIPVREIMPLLKKLESDNKIAYIDGWMAIRNFIKYQAVASIKIQAGIVAGLKAIPHPVLAKIVKKLYGMDRISEDMHILSRDIIYSNSNLNPNTNNSSSKIQEGRLSKNRGNLGDKMRIK